MSVSCSCLGLQAAATAIFRHVSQFLEVFDVEPLELKTDTTVAQLAHCVSQWLSGYRTWNSNSGTRVRFPGRATIPLGFSWASCLLTLPPQFLSSKKLGYTQKRVFGA